MMHNLSLVTVYPLRIGHTRLTHFFLQKKEQRPQCITYKTPNTVKHFLIKCGPRAFNRKRFFNADDIKDLFENINMDDVQSFLREVKLYQKL